MKPAISTKFVHEIISPKVVRTTMETCIATTTIYNKNGNDPNANRFKCSTNDVFVDRGLSLNIIINQIIVK